MAQPEDYYYEIQLSNKQLVFYFLAGATGLILSFLAGVMVGRGVDSGATHEALVAAKPVPEERVVAEEPAKLSPPVAEELTYAQRLDGEKSDDTLDKPGKAPAKPADKPSPKPSAEKAADKTPDKPKTADKDTEKPPAKATPSAKPASPRPVAVAAKPAAGTFTIQVGAFKDKETAESVVGRLKKKGFGAFVVPPEGDGLFNVRVGSYPARADAERIQAKLRDEEKFKPFIVKN